MLTDRKCEIVNNFNRCSYRKNGHKCLISRKPEDITLKNKYHKRNKKKTYLTKDLGSSINKELKEVMNDVVSEEKMSKMERMKKMSDDLKKMKAGMTDKNDWKVCVMYKMVLRLFIFIDNLHTNSYFLNV